MRAADQMRGDGNVLSEIERTGGKRRQQFVRGMMTDGHERSPKKAAQPVHSQPQS